MSMPAALRMIIVTVFLLLLIIYYGKTHFYRDPGSVFYDTDHAFERSYSLRREAESEDYIRNISESSSPNLNSKAGANPTICAAFSTVKRENTQYIENAVASLLQGLAPVERSDLLLTVLFANTNATSHPTWNKKWLRSVVDDVYTYDVTQDTFAQLQKLEETKNYREKGVFDYTYALERCYDTETPYIAMFEDDTIFAHGWLVRTLLGLQEIEPNLTKPWLYMRLFNQERSTGWSSRNIGGNHEHWIILGIAVAVLGLSYLVRRQSRVVSHRLDLGVICVVVLFTIPCLVILFFQSGKASLLPPSPGVFEEPFGCCSQAMVFPREKVPSLIKFLKKKNQGQIDLLLNNMAASQDLSRYALYPVQLQHIGTQSSRGTGSKEAQAIWSMAFETLDANSLEEEHLRMVSDYYEA